MSAAKVGGSVNKLAMVFPGQGSQKIGMLKALSKEFLLIEKTFYEASDILGLDLWNLTQNGPESKLNETEWTQPALLTASVALWRIYKEISAKIPSYLAGHSLGELGLSSEHVVNLCAEAAKGDIVSAANLNSPEQTVIAGDKAAVVRAESLLIAAGAKRVLSLPVSVPSHCALMAPAAKALQKTLETISIFTPKIPVINNVNVKIETDPVNIKQALIDQLSMPVRWIEIIQAIKSFGVTDIAECGAGQVLSGLNKRIEPSLHYFVMSTYDQLSLLLGEA
jgi:[acyl-carrier-protein] S-malonyltransferase